MNGREKSIFIVFTNFGLGGIQKKIVDITNELSGKKKLKVFLIFKDRKEFEFSPFVSSKNTKVLYKPTFFIENKVLNFILFVATIFIAYLRYKPQSILAFHHYSLLSVVPTSFFWPIFKTNVTLSQDNILSFYNKNEYTKFSLPKFFITPLYALAKNIVVQTDFAKKDLVTHFDITKGKIFVISNWVLEKSQRSSGRSIDIMYAGRFEKQKNLIAFLKIVKKISEKKKISVVMMGMGSAENMMREYIAKEKLNFIKILPPQHSINKLLVQSKILLLTSKFEGMPMTLLEAMNQGVVPFVIKSPGIIEYVFDKKNGVVTSNNREMITVILHYLKHKNELENLSKKTKLYVRKNHGHTLLTQFIDVLST